MAGPEVALPPALPPSSTSLSFTQGFLLGQLSIVILIFCFIKFFIFGEPLPADERALHLSSLRRTRTLAHHARKTSISHRPSSSGGPHPTLRHKASSILRQPPAPLTPAAILSKTYYNVNSHQPESLDWFNVLVAQTIAQLRADARQDNAILTSLTSVLNRPGKPDFLGEIRITEIELGDEFPIFSNCRVIPVNEGSGGDALRSESGRLEARLDVDLGDVITLGIETTLVLNWPKPVVAVLPVALSVSVVRFSGTLSLSFMPTDDASGPGHLASDSPTAPSSRTALTFTFLDDYRLDLSVRSLVGSRSRLQDVPKIAQLVESRLHAWFDERVVEPRFQQIILPSLWPRKRTARGGEDEEEAVASTTEGSVDERHSTLDNASDLPVPKRTTRKDLSPGSAAMFRERQRSRGPSSERSSMEARLMAEGSKIREAEEREERLRARRDERHRHSTLGQQPSSRPRDWQVDRDSEGMRWRSTHDQARNRPDPHRTNSLRPSNYSERGRQRDEWDDSRSMPGGMPGV